MTREGKKRKRGGRRILLRFLENKGCSAYVDEVLSELEKFFGNRREARQCLYDTVRAGLVSVEDNVVCYDECIHKRRVVKGLEILLLLLEELRSVSVGNPHTLPDRGVCNEFKQFLFNNYNVKSLEGVARLMKIALEHLITSGRLEYKERPTIPALARIVKELDIRIEDIRELERSITTVYEEVEDWKKNIGGCCEECVDMGLCEKDPAGLEEIKEIAERVVNLLISRICVWETTPVFTFH
jgi:hypothetical protein